MLVRAGVGRLTLVDRDFVEWSNLQRQSLYTEEDARQRLPKVVAAESRLRQINGDVRIDTRIADVTAAELDEWVPEADLLIDATDNFETRLVMNDAACKHRKPWIYGACVGSYGMTFTILPRETPCLSCLMETVPMGGATCDTAGIISPAVQIGASHQVAEALKLLVGDRDSLRRTLLAFDLWENRHHAMDVSRLKKEQCPSCGVQAVHPYLDRSRTNRTMVLCGRDSVQIRPMEAGERDLEALAESLVRQGKEVISNPFLVSFVDGTFRLTVFRDGRVLVHGTRDPAVARSICHRYLG
jgi:molybdopterin/thiamine biosynthesis adenylyltransferase